VAVYGSLGVSTLLHPFSLFGIGQMVGGVLLLYQSSSYRAVEQCSTPLYSGTMGLRMCPNHKCALI